MAPATPDLDEPPLLWHYTAFDGLKGIVTDGELFASSLAYLNDTEEFQYTIKALIDIIDESGQLVRLSDVLNLRDLQSAPKVVKAFFNKVRGQDEYVTCFSKEPDDLSQWRSYTPRPPGFAIGFHPEWLAHAVAQVGFQVLACQYPTANELRVQVEAAYREATAGMDEDKKRITISSSSADREDFADKWALRIIKAITPLALKNKHPKFSAEKEVRVHGYVSNRLGGSSALKVCYRLSGSLIVPYVKIPARQKDQEALSPIKAIVVGPCPHQDAVMAATRHMCIQNAVRAEVLPSKVPYRNW